MNKALLSSKKMNWETPGELFRKYDRIYKFNLDVCATKKNAKCKRYFNRKQDGLKQPWAGSCWMNPPYGNQIGKWIEKAYRESNNGAYVVALLPARTDTRWFHNFIYKKRFVEYEFLKGRIKFVGAKDSAPFPSMIVIFKH